MLVVLRDILHCCKTKRECKLILAESSVKVDGEARTDFKYPAGLMDVIELNGAESAFRVMALPRKGLSLIEVPKGEVSFKLCRIDDKKTLNSGAVQLNLHDGRNISIKAEDLKKLGDKDYSVLDTVQLSIPKQGIMKRLRFAEGSHVLVVAGRNIGRSGRIVKVEEATAARKKRVSIETEEKEVFQTIADYVFVVGEEKPIIKIGG